MFGYARSQPDERTHPLLPYLAQACRPMPVPALHAYHIGLTRHANRTPEIGSPPRYRAWEIYLCNRKTDRSVAHLCARVTDQLLHKDDAFARARINGLG